MITTDLPALSSIGRNLDPSPEAWGELTDSTADRADFPTLRARLREDGYLFIRNFFPREIIETARLSLLAALGDCFAPDRPLSEGLLRKGINPRFAPEAARQNPAVQRVVFGAEMKAFYEGLLGGRIRHFDYIWVRALGRGHGTTPHCDIVYMGRGTHDLYTAWIPYGDVTYDIGGLMMLEGSHLQAGRIRNYLASDVDTFCENRPDRGGHALQGTLSRNPVSLREKMGGRWLSAEYRMGDLLTFHTDTIHASLDNRTDRIRLSTDTRYQLAAEPVDERWIGDNPVGHGTAGKRGRIC